MYELTRRVGVSHTGADNRLKIVSALDMMQDCTHFWLESEPVFTGYLRDNGIIMLAASRQLDISRLPDYGETLTVRTSIYGCRKFFGYRNTAIYDQQGRACLLSWSTGVFVSLASGRMIVLPEEVAAALNTDPPLDMEYLDRKIVCPAETAQNLPPVPVRDFDIDFNGHMNNVRYVEASMDLLPGGFTPNRVRVEYKLAAGPGAVLHPSLIRADNGRYLVTLADANGKPYTVAEFTRM